MTSILAQTDLRSLVAHTLCVRAGETIASVYEGFGRHEHEFVAILDGDAVAGLCSRERLGLLLCDVMGHGVRAALIAAMIRALIQRDARKDLAPGDILTRLNRDLAGMLRKDGAVIFVTASCLLVDAGAREIRYALAGHHVPCRVGPGSPPHPLRPTAAALGPAIGLMEDFGYGTSVSPMAEGDRFLVFTDGLFEALGPGGEEFGVDRLLDQFGRHGSAPVSDMLDRVIESVRAFAAPKPLNDDVCLAALTFN